MHTIVLIRPSFDAKIKSCCVYADGFHIRPPENPYHSYASSLSIGYEIQVEDFSRHHPDNTCRPCDSIPL